MPARELDTRDGWADLALVVAQMPADQLARLKLTLPPEDVERVERVESQIHEDGWRADPAMMAWKLTGGTYKLWPYIRLLSRRFAGAFTGNDDPHQKWNLPSQYGKTSLLANYGPVWALDRDPTLRLMYVSYDDNKAVEEAGNARDFAEAHARHLRFRLRRDKRARGLWRTDQGGGLYAVGINGGITGWPVDAMLLDDLIKGWQAAHSAANRAFVVNVWRSQLRMRMQSIRNPIIAVGTRWHEADFHATLDSDADNDEHAIRFSTIVLPAIAEKDDPLGREIGMPLEADRFPLEEVLSRRATLGTYLWTAMEQQRPSPEEGGEIKRAWWQMAEQMPVRFDDQCTSWDMKLKDSEAGDYVVGQAWGRTGSDFWCRDQLRGQWNQATTRIAIALLAVRSGIRKHFIENTGNGPDLMKQLRKADPTYKVDPEIASMLGMTAKEILAVQRTIRRGMTGLLPVVPKGSKTIRLRAVSPILEGEHVHVPIGPTWVALLIDEAAGFPNAEHDDQVDSMSQALSKMSSGGGSAKSSKGTVAKPAAGRRPGKPKGPTVVTPGARGSGIGRRAPVRR